MIVINGVEASDYLMQTRTGYSPTRYSARYEGPPGCQGIYDPWMQKMEMKEQQAFHAMRSGQWCRKLVYEVLMGEVDNA